MIIIKQLLWSRSRTHRRKHRQRVTNKNKIPLFKYTGTQPGQGLACVNLVMGSFIRHVYLQAKWRRLLSSPGGRRLHHPRAHAGRIELPL